ncbi:DHA2 family efflux MFS transporter permease subunit [Streptomyces olivoreticuli]|uniref:DHA2 family efflux MFS transporter permease subunit n=1 Tax=Streptomyces olivoreticuli TaxID=68246 RepID=UPI00265929D9|nr:DHA2 family efflux MFS transporter permease subunit [Streptomyces olivoreticuli]WKK23553.1 DHA2 family efflux MFS transporter permease subunit [Streptomyces olivoreticuli]
MSSTEATRKAWALGAIGLSLLVVGVDATILNVAVPTISADLDASTSQLQWIVDAFTLVLAAALLPAGLLGDKYGRKKFLVAALILFGGASLWCAYSGSSGQLIAARAVLGLGAAFIVPMSTSVLLNLFETEQERTKAIGVIAVSTMLGLPLGPVVGGALLNHFWWGSVFLINVPLVVIGALAVAKVVPESRGSEGVGIDFLGVVISSVGLTALTFGAIEAGEKGWGSAEALLSLGGGVVALIVFVLWELRVAVTGNPLVDLRLFRTRGFVWGSVLSTIVSFAMFGLIFALPQYFQAVQGTDALGTGLRLLPMIGGLLVGASAINKMRPDIGPRAVPALGFLLVAIGLFMGTYTETDTGYGYVAVWIVVIGAGLGLAMTRSMAAALNSLAKERSGVGSAVVQALRQVGGAIGVAVLGSVANSSYRNNLDLKNASRQVEDAVSRSVSTGVAVAEKMHDTVMLGAVRDAFVDAMHTLLFVCSGIGVVAALLALAFMPRRAALPPEKEPAQDGLGDQAEAPGSPA